ncbi:MAG: type II toxin-antitoxin system RelE/ParE family toxin [Candidatus Omnitrophota bacterium]
MKLNIIYDIKLTPQAESIYLHLDVKLRERIDRVFEQFEQGAFHHRNIRSLRGRYSGKLRYRMGKWRIIFQIDWENKMVWIDAITARGGAYR